jgi:hypothetical protein
VDQTYNAVRLDLKTGKSQRVLEHWGSAGTQLSPGGRYVLYFDERNGHWYTYRIADGVRVNLTEKLKVRFQAENNTPDLPGPYGAGGWIANDQSLFLNDEFDVWEIKPDGTGARMLTGGEGRRQEIVFRYRTLDPEERVIPTTKPLLLSATNDRTRATGFYRVAYAGTSAPEKIVMLDKRSAPERQEHRHRSSRFSASRSSRTCGSATATSRTCRRSPMRTRRRPTMSGAGPS